jgi:glycosyltransferase involved in cell wall biosynthesis
LKILLRAPLLTMSGYGVHSRQIFEWLNEKKINLDVECLNWGMTPWIVNSDYEEGLIGKIMQCSRKLEPPYDMTFQLQLPDEWNPNLGKYNVGISAIVETDICNPKWIESCNKMDQIIVPSSFTKQVLLNSGKLTTNIEVVPEWFNKHIGKNNDTLDLNLKTKFNFLIISQLNSKNSNDDRKNIVNTVKWLCEEFKNNKDVGIVLKTNFGRGTTIDKNITNSLMKQMTSVIGKKEFPKIYLLHGSMKDSEVANIYNDPKIKCFVSATRGEGYGLPIIDAAASGMPIVATNWSGHLDFLNDNFLKVDYDLVAIRKEKADNRIFFEGARWANPIEKDFKEKIRYAYENNDNLQKNAKNLKISVHKDFSNYAIKKIYNNLFEKMRQ